MESLFLDSSPDYGPVKCEVNKVCSTRSEVLVIAAWAYKNENPRKQV